ncbi:MAG: LLM class flavin-dependent oxidoreductase [Actinomycetia bacterium]|nr:LLM class flavin-dependent oxidoreductase [Actinomycetes bacterium]
MDFGVFFCLQDWDDYLYGIKEAENHGFDFCGIIDSPYNFMDCYPVLGAAALETKTIQLGPYVTNPLTRHPSVTASAMATVDVMSGGRAFLGLGRGDSAVKMLGWRPAKWKLYDQSIKDMRAWMRGEPVDVKGAPAPVQLTWSERDIPINLGVFGPRGAKTAGQLGDIATTECAELGAVEWFHGHTQQAAKEAGREPIAFEVSIATYVSNDMAKAREMCRWEPEILTNLIWQLMRTYGIEALPESLTRGFEWLAEKEDWWGEHDWSKHAQVDEAHQEIITDEIVDRFCVLGSPQNCIDKLRELEKLGVSRFCAYLVSLEDQAEILQQLRLWGDEIIPEFK